MLHFLRASAVKLQSHGVALVLVIAAMTLAPSSSAQTPTKVHRIGLILSSYAVTSPWRDSSVWKAFFTGLAEHGYVEGRNLVVEVRGADGHAERLPTLAAELVATRPDVILAGVCGAPLNAVRGATSTIPIVVAACTEDMVASGVVASLARPGGNVTGLQKLTPELAAKRLEMLKAHRITRCRTVEPRLQ